MVYKYVFRSLVKVGIHSSSISRVSKKPTKDSRVSLISSATCSSNTRFFKASISVMHSFSNNTKTWRPPSNNSSSSLRIIPPLLLIVIRHHIHPRQRSQMLSTTLLQHHSGVCRLYCSHHSQPLCLVRAPLRVHINHHHQLPCSELLGIPRVANRCVAFIS